MFKTAIDYLNAKLDATGFFNEINCIAEKIEREGKTYPALCLGDQYKPINLDPKGSLSYWRKNGDVSFSKEENVTAACNVQYVTNIPLKLVGFVRKDSPYNDCYFADSIAREIIGFLTTSNSALKGYLKAKSVNITAEKYVTDPRTVASEEYSDNQYEARYSHAYFSIDFNLEIISNQNCYPAICDLDNFVPNPSSNLTFCERVEQCPIITSLQDQIDEIEDSDVESVNGQTGVVVLTTSDISEGTNLYFTEARVRSTVLTGLAAGVNTPIIATNSILTAFQNLQAQISANGNGTVTSVSVVTNQGVSGSVATSTTTPAITLTLGSLTGVTSINGLVITANTGAITTGTWNATAIGAQYGGTDQTVYAVGDILYANTTTSLTKLADVAIGSYLRSGGVNTAPLWSTLKLPNAVTVNQIIFASATDTYGASANLTYDGTIIQFTSDSSILKLRSLVGSTSIPAIYGNQTTPSATNYAFSAGTSFTQMNSTTLLQWMIGGAEKMRMTSTFELLIQGTALYGALGQPVEVNRAGAGGATYGGIASNSWNSNTTRGSYLSFNRSLSATTGTHTLVTNGTLLGGILWTGSNGTTFINGAQIIAEVDGTAGTGNDMPTRIGIYTTPDGSGTLALRWTIGNAGSLLGAAGMNIDTDTSTGMKIWSTSTMKGAFWGAAPIVQPTTAVTESAYVENAGGVNVNDDSTFDGYTLRQVVKALRNTGILA